MVLVMATMNSYNRKYRYGRTSYAALLIILVAFNQVKSSCHAFLLPISFHQRLNNRSSQRPNDERTSSPSSSSSHHPYRGGMTTTKATRMWMKTRAGGGVGTGEGARGAALLLENASVYRGPDRILGNVNWRIEPRTKWALVGTNGCGKSTLLKAIVGEIPVADGRIAIGIKGRLGYLQQTAVAGSNRTIYEEAASGMEQVNKAREAMEKAMVAQDIGNNIEALQRATARFEAVGGYQQEQKVSNVLRGLGFASNDYHSKRCDALSGGWQMRVAFARLLLSEPAICLMDEPGNHLDAAAKKWLAKYLADYKGDGSMILVTHDISLLKSMDHIAEIIPGTGSLQVYKSCTYDQYLQLKEQRASAAITEYEKNAEKAAKLQAFVDRFGASATKASAAQSRVKQIERMEREGLLDAPAQALVATRFRPTLVLPDPPKAIGDMLLSLKDAQIGYYKGKPLVTNINLEITRGMKILIRGPNGAGKSTVLHALRGTLPLLSGERRHNPSLRLGMFTQDLAQELDHNSVAVDVVTSYAREGSTGDVAVSAQDARSVMGRLGLQGDKSLRRIRDLSGGERARVCLSMFALKPSNLYLFDEVSNHLDVECVECLSDALRTWGNETGAFIVVSHDRHFCQQLEFTHVATVQDGRLVLEQRNAVASDWLVEGMSGGAVNPSTKTSKTTDAEVKASDAMRRKKAYNAPKRISQIEDVLASLEQRIATIDSEMMAKGGDVAKLMELTKEKEKLESQVSVYMAEWTELEELLSLVEVA